MLRGFVLHTTYRIEGGRPVVHVWGRLESGASFLVRDTRPRPHFWIPAAAAARAEALGAKIVAEPAGRVDMRGNAVARIELTRPQDTPVLRDRLFAAGIECFEADVRFAYRYLIDRGIRASLSIEGVSRAGRGVDLVFEDPTVGPADWQPRLRVLSLDIETDPLGRRLLSAALHGCGASDVLLLTPPGWACPSGAVACATEQDLVRALVRRVQELDPDVLTGWNVIDFDLAVLDRIGMRCGVPLVLGRTDERIRIDSRTGGRGPSRATIPGRVVLDGIDLLRGAFVRVESYALESVAREILGRGKTITGKDRAQEIMAAFESDRPHLVEYNRNDARLVLEILDHLHLVELAVERSRLTGLPPDRVGASIAAFDFLYLSELGRRGIVAPTVRARDAEEPAGSGGHVLAPRPGLYRNVLAFDFKSLYPNIVRTFQIDPWGHAPAPEPGADLLVAPNGAAFRRDPGILPGLLDDLFPRREAASAAGDRVASQAIKILMNSFYGVLGTPACRFSSPALANAITSFGREILLWTKARIEAGGLDVLYGDTDSLFVRSAVEDPEEALRLGERLRIDRNAELTAHVREKWRVESRLELEFEQLYLRFLLPEARHGRAGARKRYAGLVAEPGGARVVFTGMEVVRRDWTELARRVQRELYTRLFHDLPVDDYLRGIVSDLRASRLDELLVYRKSVRRPLDDYTAATPPHVAAARKLSRPATGRIEYVITASGPEPLEARSSPIDHEHYVQKQVRAVAEPVLTLLGLDFDRVIGDELQLSLF